MKHSILVITLWLAVCVAVANLMAFNIGKDYENDRISKCIFGNEIGINYYHFAKIGKCLSK